MDIDVQKELYNLVGIEATDGQLPILLDDSRFILIAGGERAGKSFVAAVKALPRLLEGDLFWLVGKEYAQCQAEWNYLVEFLTKLGWLDSPPTKNIDPGEIRFLEGKRIITKPTSHPEKIATMAPDGIIACESAQIEFEAHLRLRGRLAEKRGWMIESGTFESSIGSFVERYTRWQGYNDEEAKSHSLPSWTNSVVYPGGRLDPEILSLERNMPTDKFMERHGGEPCPPSNRAIPEFSNKIHVGEYKYNPQLPVMVWIDPGYAGAYSILAVQKWAEQVVIVDEVYLQGYVTKEMIIIAQNKPWWNLVESGVIDIAGKQHQAMEAPTEVWLTEGHLPLRSQKVKEEYGVELLRSFLKVNPLTGKPRLLVDAGCKGFISECGGCRSPVDGGGMWLRDKVTRKLVDRNNHSVKACIYGLVDSFGYAEKAGFLPKIKIFGTAPSKAFVRT